MGRAKRQALMHAFSLAAVVFAVTFSAHSQEWNTLSTSQQEVLRPLQPHWPSVPHARRKIWIGIAERHRTLDPTAQARLNERMLQWHHLSDAQRQHVMHRYKKHKALAPERQREIVHLWHTYTELPEVQKADLRTQARP